MRIVSRIAASAAAVLAIAACSTAATTGASASTSNCISAPATQCGFAGSSNTGYGVAESKLKVDNKAIVLNKAGETLSYVNTDKPIDVTAANVTITHDRIDVAGQEFGITLEKGATNVTITHNVIRGAGTSASLASGEAIKDIYGVGLKADIEYNNIYDWGDGVQTYQGTISNNYIHQLIDANGWHLEDINENGNAGLPLTISGNTLLNSAGQTAAIYIGADFDKSANVTVNHNLMAGGGYVVYGGAKGVGADANPSNIVFTNNIFSAVYYPDYGYWGLDAYFSDTAPGDVWSNNRADNGTKTGGKVLGS